MSQVPGYAAWHPRRLPQRQDSADSSKFFSSRPQTPTFGRDLLPGERAGRPQLERNTSQASLLTLQLETPDFRQTERPSLHARVHSIAQRVPLPQGISLAVGVCTALAFGLSVTTLVIGMHNREMLLAATEARHDPHGPLASLIYTAVLHALRSNMTQVPFDKIIADPN